MVNKPIVIIGTGLAGYHVAKEFRKLDTETELLLITQDDGHFYSKPQLSTAISYGKNPQALIITAVELMRAQLNAQIYTHSTVQHIDSKNKTIQVDSPTGSVSIAYRDLVIALGASPKAFPLLDNYENHYRINNLKDYHQFIEKTENSDSLCIIGSGLVGCEFANDLSKIKKISVITIDPYPLYNLVPESIGHALQKALEELGINFYTNACLETVNVDDHKSHFKFNLSSKQSIETHAVVTAIGLQPNCALAKSASLQTNQGIVVNSFLQTTHPHIYALGDCAEIEGICHQYVAPLLQSARALAQTLTGTPTRISLPLTPISLKVNTYPVIVHPPKTNGGWQLQTTNTGIKALSYDENGTLQGYALGGSAIEYRQECLKAVTNKASLTV